MKTRAASIAIDLVGLFGAGIEVPGNDSPFSAYSDSKCSNLTMAVFAVPVWVKLVVPRGRKPE